MKTKCYVGGIGAADAKFAERQVFWSDGPEPVEVHVYKPIGHTITPDEWRQVWAQVDADLTSRAVALAETSLIDSGGHHDWVWDGLDPEDYQDVAAIRDHVEDAAYLTYQYAPGAVTWGAHLTWDEYRELMRYDIEQIIDEMCAWAGIDPAPGADDER